MAKVIMTIAPEDGMFFGDIFSFKTENYIGMFNNVTDNFMLMKRHGRYFEPWNLEGSYENLRDLDDAVFELCDEHITEVFDTSDYIVDLG